MFLLFESIEIPLSLTVFISFAMLVAGVLVTIVYFRSGLQEKTLTGYKTLYEIEEKSHIKTKAELLVKETELIKTTQELDTVSKEYAGLAQLYAKKSYMLESLTGDVTLRWKIIKAIKALDIEQLDGIRAIHSTLEQDILNDNNNGGSLIE